MEYRQSLHPVETPNLGVSCMGNRVGNVSETHELCVHTNWGHFHDNRIGNESETPRLGVSTKRGYWGCPCIGNECVTHEFGVYTGENMYDPV